jgi:Lantibiotic dehydratase, N terminus
VTISSPDHHVPLDAEWVLWKWFIVRGAGFPASDVLRLAAPQSATAADQLVDAEDRFERLRNVMIESCRSLRDTPTRGPALKRLFRGEVPASPIGEAALDKQLDELTQARSARDTARRDCEQMLQVEQRAVSETLREIANSPRFQEALLLQNRAALSSVVRGLAHTPIDKTDGKTRQREAFIARYYQRYTTKNDSISFFGPIGWGAITPSGPAIEVKPGPSLLSRRHLFFEYWGIDTLAGALSQDERIRPQIAPRRMPTVRVEDSVLHLGLGRSAKVLPVFAALVAACDGERSAHAIAEELCADASYELSGPDEVYELLGELVEKRLVVWSLEIPTDGNYPERALRAGLERMEPGEARSEALAKLDELEASRDAIAKAAGNPVALERALIELDDTFTRLTGAAATRRAGQIYAARTLLCEECVRDVQLSLGPSLIAELAPPLSLLLQSSRWFTFELARVYGAILEQNWARLSASLGEEIEYTTFVSEIAELLSETWLDKPSAPVREASEGNESRWAEVLHFSPSERRVERTSAELRSSVERLFAAPHGGWPSARFHSPDLAIAAKSVEDIARGDFTFVLGELHSAANTVTSPSTLALSLDMQPFVAAMSRDCHLPMVCAVNTKEHATRVAGYSLVPRDFEIETGAVRSWRPRDHVLALGELVVARHQGKLVVRTRDGRAIFDLLAILDHNLSASSLQHFRLLPEMKHSPRVSIDKLVVSRERWSFAHDEIPFAHLPTATERFVGARRWARSAGVPRLAFYRTPEETKPLFIDFESPTYVEIMAHQLRNASSFSITEMYPSIDDCWLPDREGKRYTSELRIAAFDLAPMAPWFEGK